MVGRISGTIPPFPDYILTFGAYRNRLSGTIPAPTINLYSLLLGENRWGLIGPSRHAEVMVGSISGTAPPVYNVGMVGNMRGVMPGINPENPLTYPAIGLPNPISGTLPPSYFNFNMRAVLATNTHERAATHAALVLTSFTLCRSPGPSPRRSPPPPVW